MLAKKKHLRALTSTLDASQVKLLVVPRAPVCDPHGRTGTAVVNHDTFVLKVKELPKHPKHIHRKDVPVRLSTHLLGPFECFAQSREACLERLTAYTPPPNLFRKGIIR